MKRRRFTILQYQVNKDSHIRDSRWKGWNYCALELCNCWYLVSWVISYHENHNIVHIWYGGRLTCVLSLILAFLGHWSSLSVSLLSNSKRFARCRLNVVVAHSSFPIVFATLPSSYIPFACVTSRRIAMSNAYKRYLVHADCFIHISGPHTVHDLMV